MLKTLKKFVLGRPLANAELVHQRLSKRVALAVFSSDALSSVAYATEEILLILVVAGLGATHFALPVAIGIAILLAILIISYSETIHSYPNGGGAYSVAKENLGKYPSLIAAAALLTDYVLTVSVSSASAVAAITSAFPSLYPHQVGICLLGILVITIANLRGVKESGLLFSIPTYTFIGSFLFLIAVGLYHYFAGKGPIVYLENMQKAVEPLTYFVILKAFSSGCAALTGIEAISNGVPAFKKPESRNAALTLVIMGVILLSLFMGITELARVYRVYPLEHETVISQIARHVFGQNIIYYLIQVSTALILFVAANTAFADFPRLSSLLARDGFLPRQLMSLGDRLAFSNGIMLLGLASGVLIVMFHAETHALVPLYAVGVFISFTLSQSGMVVHHFRDKPKWWRQKVFINGLGASLTGVASIVIAVTKFAHGAWMVILFLPILIGGFLIVKRHYNSIVTQLTPEPTDLVQPRLHRVLVPISTFHKGTVKALTYAKSISQDVRAIYICLNPERTAIMRDIWDKWKIDIPLVILDSPYRSISYPLTDYIDELQKEKEPQTITVVLPEFIPAKWWQQILHNQTALMIRSTLMSKKGVIVTSVRYFLKH